MLRVESEFISCNIWFHLSNATDTKSLFMVKRDPNNKEKQQTIIQIIKG